MDSPRLRLAASLEASIAAKRKLLDDAPQSERH